MRSSLATFERRDVVAGIRRQRARTIALLEDLSVREWDVPVLPGWRVREVAAHLVSTDEAALTGRMLAFAARRVEMEALEAWNETQVARWSGRPVPALLHGLQAWGARIARGIALMPQPIAAARVPSPFGRVSPLWLGMMRVYDEWVHGQDLRRALARPGDDDPASVTRPARQLLAAIPLQTLPRIPDGGGTVTLQLDVEVPPLVVDMSNRRYGFGLPAAGTTIRARAARLIMAAAGRDTWQELESAGELEILGDLAPAHAFLDSLRVV